MLLLCCGTTLCRDDKANLAFAMVDQAQSLWSAAGPHLTSQIGTFFNNCHVYRRPQMQGLHRAQVHMYRRLYTAKNNGRRFQQYLFHSISLETQVQLIFLNFLTPNSDFPFLNEFYGQSSFMETKLII